MHVLWFVFSMIVCMFLGVLRVSCVSLISWMAIEGHCEHTFFQK